MIAFTLRYVQLLCLVLLSGLAQATTYYVSIAGNDANNGTSTSTAWQTIARVNQAVLSPGDEVLFERGGVFRGEVVWDETGAPGLPITYGAYGASVDNPIISGSRLVTNWSNYSGNIYRAAVGQQVDRVYVNGQLTTIARTPNAGLWYRNSNGQNNTMTSANITQSSGYFTGARCILRSTASSVDTLRITNHSGSTLTFGNNPTNSSMGQDDWGFFVENKLNLLDAAGEWFYDKSNGYLYLWAPGSANPNSLTVEASVYYSGVNCSWQRNYCVIQNLTFQHQTYAGVHNGGANFVTVDNCIMQDTYHGIRSYGTYDTYSNNIIRRTGATGALLIDQNVTFQHNVLEYIGLAPGLGESNWGYFGVRSLGQNGIIRGNTFNHIGYIAIIASGSQLIEQNVVTNYTELLNDGGGIAFDNADQMTIQDNIIRDAIGGLDGSSTVMPHYQHAGVGIYFGNTCNTNVTVRRNTIINVSQYGIVVDHTTCSAGYLIQDNVIFNTGIGINVSDYSNSTLVAAYNDLYDHNQIYCQNKDQLCLKIFNCHGSAFVDFGTFTNNAYYNPYQSASIHYHNTYTANSKRYTLKSWQNARGEDLTSTSSPIKRSSYATVSELTGNLLIGGDFTNPNVSGWQAQAWPNNAQLTHNLAELDSGSLKVWLPNPSISARLSYRNPDWFPVVNQAWYRMRMSVVSPTTTGTILWGLKAQSSMNNPYAVYEQLIGFDDQRSEQEIYLQSTLTDNCQVRFISPGSYLQNGSDYTESDYYIDNVDVRRVTVQPIDPNQYGKIFVNVTDQTQLVSVPAGDCWSDLDGVGYSANSSITLPPFGSKILYQLQQQCVNQDAVSVKALLAGCTNWTTGLMNDNLRMQQLIPLMQPYSLDQVDNPTATIDQQQLQNKGDSSVVDWVVVQLKDPTSGYDAVASQACLILRNGAIITSSGSSAIGFGMVSPIGKHIVVKHRNHLAAMSAAAVSGDNQLIDLSVPLSTYGTNSTQANNGYNALLCGDSNGDHMIKYTGNNNDRDAILTLLGVDGVSGVIAGYLPQDINMDGVVKYTGSNNDRDPILAVVGFGTPNGVRIQQVP